MGVLSSPGQEWPRTAQRSIRFTFAAMVAVPVVCLVVLWVLAASATPIGVVVEAVAVLVSAAVMGLFARRLVHEISDLEATARHLADEQLPRLVERLRRGEPAGQADQAYPYPQGRITEVARVAAAIASLQQAAVAAAAGEARLRNGIGQVFVSLARRNQSLLQRQLRLIDALEQKAPDPAALADLFPLDHLTTRMRRHAEGLIILSGAAPGRSWSEPVPVIDVIRGAVAEVEEYKRVAVLTIAEDAVAGSAAADMIHLLAELVENATLFSPSGTRVEIRAERVANGFAIEIDDRGLGIEAGQLNVINGRLAHPPDFDLANADQLGLFVVGKLAARHAVRVSLRASPFGGTTAVVLMPNSIVVPVGDTEAAPLDARAAIGGRPAGLERHSEALALTGRQPARPPLLSTDAVTRPVTAAGSPPAVAANGADGAGAGGPASAQAAGTYRGLPRRVRQASLSPHLRSGAAGAAHPPEAATPPSGDRTPEEARDLVASLQSGWQRGRQTDTPDADTAPGHTVDWPESRTPHNEET